MPFFPAEKKLFAVNLDGYSIALDLFSGELLWQGTEKSIPAGIEYDNLGQPLTVCLVTTQENGYLLSALDFSTYQKRWRTFLKTNGEWTIKLYWLFSQETFHIPFQSKVKDRSGFKKTFATLRRKNGEVLGWGEVGSDEFILATNQTLLLQSRNSFSGTPQKIKGINPLTNEEKWNLEGKLFWEGIFENYLIYYDEKVKTLGRAHIDSGERSWEVSVIPKSDTGVIRVTLDKFYRPLGSLEPKRFYSLFSERSMGTQREYLISKTVAAFEAKTGKKLWERQMAPPEISLEFLGEIRGTLILKIQDPPYGPSFSGIDASNGNLRWQIEESLFEDLILPSEGEPAIPLVVGYNRKARSIEAIGLDTLTGKAVWSQNWPALVGSFDSWFFKQRIVGKGQNVIFVADAQNGNLLLSFPIPAGSHKLVGSGENFLYFILVDEKTPNDHSLQVQERKPHQGFLSYVQVPLD